MDGNAGNVLIVHTLVTVATVPKGHLNVILSTSPSCTSGTSFGTSLVSNASAESQGTPCTPCTCESRENWIDFEAKLVGYILPAHAFSSQVIQHQSAAV